MSGLFSGALHLFKLGLRAYNRCMAVIVLAGVVCLAVALFGSSPGPLEGEK